MASASASTGSRSCRTGRGLASRSTSTSTPAPTRSTCGIRPRTNTTVSRWTPGMSRASFACRPRTDTRSKRSRRGMSRGLPALPPGSASGPGPSAGAAGYRFSASWVRLPDARLLVGIDLLEIEILIQGDSEEHLQPRGRDLELAQALAQPTIGVEAVEHALVRDEPDPGLSQGVEDVPAVAVLARADDLGLVLVEEADALLVLGVLRPVDDFAPFHALAGRLGRRPVVVQRELFAIVVLVAAGREQREGQDQRESFHVTSSGFRSGWKAWEAGGPAGIRP